MLRLRIPLFLALGLLGPASSSWAAGLVWERETIEVAAQSGQRVVHVEFPFQNAGVRAVTIVSVETSCRCTSADSSKKVYGPGERDAIRVDFAVGANEGVVEKTVTVTTDGPEPSPFILTLRVAIPRPATPR